MGLLLNVSGVEMSAIEEEEEAGVVNEQGCCAV